MGAGADTPLAGMMDEVSARPDKYARVRDVSMNMMAAAVVSLLRKVVPPLAPKTDWLPPAPKDAPISAPLPDWSKTIPISARQTRM